MKTVLLAFCLLLLGATVEATTVRSSSSNSWTGSTDIDISAPTGTTTGDVTIVILSTNGVVTHTDNNGSTAFTKDLAEYSPNNSATLTIWSRRIQAGDPSTYNFTLSANVRWSVIAVTFQSPHPTAIYDVFPVDGTWSLGTNPACDSVTTLTINAIHMCIVQIDNGTGAFTSTPGTYTVQQQIDDAGQPTVAVTKVIASPSATGTQSFTIDTSLTWITANLVIKDSSAVAAAAVYRRRVIFR